MCAMSRLGVAGRSVSLLTGLTQHEGKVLFVCESVVEVEQAS